MMAYLALGALLLWLGFKVYRRNPGLQRGRWRVGSGVLASVLLAAAAFLGVRGLYAPAAVVGLAAFVLAGMTRSRREAPVDRKARSGSLSADDARSILGVAPDAGEAEIQAAYTRLMRLAHPDKGGTTGLAAQLNAARDRLLKR